MISLRQRLSQGLMLILCLVFVLQWLAADWVIRSVAEKQMATRLQDDAISLLETLSSDDNGNVSFNRARMSSVYARSFSGHYYVVQVDATANNSASLAQFPLPLTPIGPNQSLLYHEANGPNQQPLLVFGLGLVQFGHKIVISVAESLSAVDHDISAIRFAYFSLTVLILGCAIALQRYDVKRALQPLSAVSQELEAISSGQQQQITVAVPSEITPLVNEVNHLLALVVRRLEQSRTAIGNLAHAIKHPVAMLFRVAEHPAFEPYPELRHEVQNQTDAIYRAIERELKRARIAGHQNPSVTFNPRLELHSLVTVLQHIYADKALTINAVAPDVLLPVDREDLLGILGNLLDNACKWAKHTVAVEITCTPSLHITVADDGPGCADVETASLTQRGLRLDESIPGHGLGLAIVRDTVECYGGVLQLGRSEQLGGFLASVDLPL